MTAVLAVCLALAAIAAVWLGARASRLSTRLGEATEEVTALEEAAESAERERSTLAASLTRATTDAAEAAARAEAADAARTAAEADLGTAREAAAAAEASAAEAEARAEEADTRAGAAAAELEQVLAERSAAAGDEEWRGGPGPEVLWALERSRTERTWRTSVAADPTADAFEPGQDPVRRAVEIDLAALREEVGVEFTLTWDLEDELGGIAALALLRSAQELVAAATRVADEATVSVAADGGDVVITLLEPDGATGRFTDLAADLAGRGLEVVPGGVRLLGAVPPSTP